MAAIILSESVRATKHPTLVQVLNRLPLGCAVIDLDRHRLGKIEPERQRQHHSAGFGVGCGPHHRRQQQLPCLTLEHLLDGAAVEGLAIARALDAPCGGWPVRRLRRRGARGGRDQDNRSGRTGHQHDAPANG